MAPEKRKPPDGLGRLSWGVLADGFDFARDKPSDPRKQAATGLLPIGSVAAEIVADLKFRCQVERVHALGPRAVGELLAELGAERSITTIIDRRLDAYAGLDPEAIEATAGDGFRPAPLREVKP